MTKLHDKLIEFRDNCLFEFENDFINEASVLRALATYGVMWIAVIAFTFVIPVLFILRVIDETVNITIRIARIIFKRTFEKWRLAKIRKSMLEYEQELLNDGLLKIEQFEIVDETTLEEFIERFVNYYTRSFFSVNLYGEFTCGRDKRKSLGDIYRTCKFYFPDCTLREVTEILIKLLQKGRITGGSYCTTIHKYVFHMQSNHYSPDDYTEYGDDIKFKDIINCYKEENL